MNKSLLIPPQIKDARSIAIENLMARLHAVDLEPILVFQIDKVKTENLPHLAKALNLTGALWNALKTEAAQRAALKESFLWHYRKGTPWAIKTALGWLGFEVEIFEDRFNNDERWTEYELEFKDDFEPTPEIVGQIKDLAEYAAPARAHLQRLFYEYNRRILIASRGKEGGHSFSGTALLSDDSGVWINGVKVSLGATYKLHASNAENLKTAQMLTRFIAENINLRRGLIWAFHLDTDKTPLESKVAVMGLYTFFWDMPTKRDTFNNYPRTWEEGIWDDRLWRGNISLKYSTVNA